MSMTDMFVEKAVAEGAATAVVDNITRATPAIATLPIVQTNKGRQNVVEVFTDVDSIPQTELDAPLQDVNATSKLEPFGLVHWSAKQDVGIGKLNELGKTPGQYFEDKATRVFRKTAQNFESTMMYQAQDFAIAENKKTGSIFKDNRVHNLGGATANNFSIQIVTWDGETTTGLYDNASFGGERDAMFEVSAPLRRFNAANVEVWTSSYRMDAGIQLADPQLVTSIVNITNSATIVADIISAKLDYALSLQLERADPATGQCYIYMHPELKVAIENAFVNSINSTSFKIGAYDTTLTTWMGVPIIPTRNLKAGTEAKITL